MDINFLVAAYPWLTVAASALLGLLLGSFLNVVIHRLPLMMMRQFRGEVLLNWPELKLPAEQPPLPAIYNLVLPKSGCPKCGTAIKPWDNIPVISWLLLRGKCRQCSNPISGRYPLVELLTGLAFGWSALHFGWSLALAGALIFTTLLIALIFIDIDEMLLPDQLTLPLLWLGLLFNLQGTYASLPEAVIGAVAGYLSLWSVYWGFKLLTGKEGMGYGDFKLLAALGAWMGWQQLPLIVLLSSAVGAAFGIAALLKRGESQPLPFGPYLAIAGWIAFFWGEAIVSWYLSLM